MTSLHCVHHVTPQCKFSVMTSLSWWPWDDDGPEGVCRLGSQVLGPGPGCSCCLWPGHSELRKIWRKTVNTAQRREQRARGLIMMGGAPGPVTGGRENHPETVRVQSDRVTNYFCRHRKLFYTAPSKFLWWIGAFTRGSTKCCVTRTGDINIRAWPQHRLATVGHRLSIAYRG